MSQKFLASIWIFLFFPALASDQKKECEELEYLVGVLTTIVTLENMPNETKDFDAEQAERLKLCRTILDHHHILFINSEIKPKLIEFIHFIWSQSPENLTAKQLPLMPLKYFNLFSHLIDHARPLLEKNPLCAHHFTRIKYKLSDYKPFKYRTYNYNKPSGPKPTVLAVVWPWERNYNTLRDKEAYDTEYESGSQPHLKVQTDLLKESSKNYQRREAMSPKSPSYTFASLAANTKTEKEENDTSVLPNYFSNACVAAKTQRKSVPETIVLLKKSSPENRQHRRKKMIPLEMQAPPTKDSFCIFL